MNPTHGPDPAVRLEHARALAQEAPNAAIAEIRRALAPLPPYAFFARAQSLITRLCRVAGGHARECRVAVLGTRTTALLTPVLQACCLRDRIRADIYEGLYGSVDQEILDPASGLSRFVPDVVFLIGHWRDCALPAVSAEPDAVADRYVAGREALWQRLSERFGCHVVQFNVDYPAEDAFGYLGLALPGGRARVIESINRRLLERAPAHVSILDAAGLERAVGGARWHDPNLWFNFQQHPSTEALPAVADLMAAHLRAILGLTRKVLVTDLDNTLWKGVIGEDGLHGIEIGPGSPSGEAHERLQEYLLELKARGVLLAVCSKNNPEDARLPFERHPGMRLRLDDFAAFRANWDDKARNLSAIAQELSLGLDSFVFLDDHPLEREWVRAQHPDVAVVELGASPLQYVAALDRGRYFFSLTLSREDERRASLYREEAARRQLEAASGSLDEFLAGLEMEAAEAPITAENLGRVTQLVNKTNQFNLTTRRYTELQVDRLASAPDGWARAFRLSDRLGDYGVISVVLCRAGGAPLEWEIDTWLMSCRALGRQMERFVFDRLVEAAQARGIRTLIGLYRPTAKNGIVASLYDDLGFTRVAEGDGEVRYALAVPCAHTPKAAHIRFASPGAAAAARTRAETPAADAVA